MAVLTAAPCVRREPSPSWPPAAPRSPALLTRAPAAAHAWPARSRQQELDGPWHASRFVRPYVHLLSPELWDLLSQILHNDPASRVNLEGIKEHPWMARQVGVLGSTPHQRDAGLEAAACHAASSWRGLSWVRRVPEPHGPPLCSSNRMPCLQALRSCPVPSAAQADAASPAGGLAARAARAAAA